LNGVNPTDPALADLIPQFPVTPQLDDPPALHEVEVAVKGLKNNKVAGPDGLPAKVFKHGEHHLIRHLHHAVYPSSISIRAAESLTFHQSKSSNSLLNSSSTSSSKSTNINSSSSSILKLIKRVDAQKIRTIPPETLRKFRVCCFSLFRHMATPAGIVNPMRPS